MTSNGAVTADPTTARRRRAPKLAAAAAGTAAFFFAMAPAHAADTTTIPAASGVELFSGIPASIFSGASTLPAGSSTGGFGGLDLSHLFSFPAGSSSSQQSSGNSRPGYMPTSVPQRAASPSLQETLCNDPDPTSVELCNAMKNPPDRSLPTQIGTGTPTETPQQALARADRAIAEARAALAASKGGSSHSASSGTPNGAPDTSANGTSSSSAPAAKGDLPLTGSNDLGLLMALGALAVAGGAGAVAASRKQLMPSLAGLVPSKGAGHDKPEAAASAISAPARAARAAVSVSAAAGVGQAARRRSANVVRPSLAATARQS